MHEARRRGLTRRQRGRGVLAALTAVLVTAVLMAALAACGGDSADGDPLVGFWLGGGSPDGMTMVQVGKDRDDYVVLTNPDAPAGDAVREGDSLVVDSHAVTMTLTPAGPDQLSLTFSGSMFASPQAVVLERVDATQYADASVAAGLAVLRRGLAMWKAGGGKKYPPAEEVAADGLLGTMVRWPSNPFTGGPMEQGEDPGDFTYERLDSGRKYALTARLSDGGIIGD
ncbi:MAG: hypothetical protein GX624_11240 [Actinobacteria bacterium]|nr:hypothetical protein [Actinomycetota bacterium]